MPGKVDMFIRDEQKSGKRFDEHVAANEAVLVAARGAVFDAQTKLASLSDKAAKIDQLGRDLCDYDAEAGRVCSDRRGALARLRQIQATSRSALIVKVQVWNGLLSSSPPDELLVFGLASNIVHDLTELFDRELL